MTTERSLACFSLLLVLASSAFAMNGQNLGGSGVALLERARSNRASTIRDAIAGLESAEGTELKAYLEVLGALRAEEAARTIANRITFFPAGVPVVCRTECEAESFYPAAVALVSVGAPSISPVRDLLLSSREPVERRLAVWVLVRVLGKMEARCVAGGWAPDEQAEDPELLEWTIREIELFEPDYGIPYEIRNRFPPGPGE